MHTSVVYKSCASKPENALTDDSPGYDSCDPPEAYE